MKTVVLLIFLGLSAIAQQNDSLLFQVLSLDNDTERVNQLYSIGFNYRTSDPQNAYLFAINSEQEAKKCSNPKFLAKAYNLLGVLYYRKGEIQKALQFQKQALKLNQQANFDFGCALNFTNLGNIHTDLKDYVNAENYYLKALNIYNKQYNKTQIAKCLMNIGILKHDQHELDAAYQQFKIALYYAKSINDFNLMANCYNNIGIVYRAQHKPDSALFYFEESMKLKLMSDNDLELVDSYNNIALMHIELNNLKEVNYYLQAADSMSKALEYNEGLIEVLDTKSRYFEVLQKSDSALYFLKKSIALKDSLRAITTEENYEFDDNIKLQLQPKQQSYSAIIFISSLLGLLIIIPMYLIRNKR